jgi:peptidyl-tRNA hydrolase
MAVVVFGLGNDEVSYYKTKHNAGRLVVQSVAQELGLEFKKKPNFSYVKLPNTPMYLLYTGGFMNDCGSRLVSFLKYFDLDNSQTTLLCLQDDSDQVELAHKLVQFGGSGGHKGIDSIYSSFLSTGLDTTNFWRLKIGIRPVGFLGKSLEFVLKPNNKKSLEYFEHLGVDLVSNLGLLESNHLDKLQNKLNTNAT